MKSTWTHKEIEQLINMFPDHYSCDVAATLNKTYSQIAYKASKLGLKKSESFRNMELKKQGDRLKIVGASSRFSPGTIPPNKGKKMKPAVYERCKATMFKKGQLPHNSYKDWQQVLRKDKTGKSYWLIKLPNERKLKHKHVWLWKKHNGEVPKGYNVVFKNGDTTNCVIENLECISNTELMQRNTIHRFPAELKSTIRLVNKLKKAINEK